MTDPRDALTIARTSNGKLVRRPLSPHLQVYKPQLTSVLSIMNRATGIALSVGTVLLVWWFVAAATSDNAYAGVSGFMRSPIGLLFLLGWVASLWYHFFNGIRHLAWDAGYGYNLPHVHATGWAVIAVTAVVTVATMIAIVIAL